MLENPLVVYEDMRLAKAEEFLAEKIFPELERGRPNWDKPHTIGVVHYIKRIIDANPQLNLDRHVLIIAAYAHDWGYAGLFEGGNPVQIDEIRTKKEDHAVIGARKIAELLKEPVFDYLTVTQKSRIVHLVLEHDHTEDLREPDEKVLMEADTLGALDPEVAKPTFIPEKDYPYIAKSWESRFNLFLTDYSRGLLNGVLQRRAEFYKNLQKNH